MKKLPLIARILLGLIFFVFGNNGFLHFIPMPPMPDQAGAFLGALAATGYFFPFIKTVEILGGLLLLSGYYVPLALLLLAGNVVNIFLFHLFLAPGGLPLAIVVVVLEAYLGFFAYRGAFKAVLKAK